MEHIDLDIQNQLGVARERHLWQVHYTGINVSPFVIESCPKDFYQNVLETPTTSMDYSRCSSTRYIVNLLSHRVSLLCMLLCQVGRNDVWIDLERHQRGI